jgi:drug/metabolite transporter (DMT)-like permease
MESPWRASNEIGVTMAVSQGAIYRLVIDGASAFGDMTPAKRHRLAVWFLILSGVSLAGMMSSVKLAVDTLSLWQVIFLRAAIGALVLAPIMIRTGVSFAPNGKLGLYSMRVGFAVGGITCWLYSIAHLPLGVASALTFSKSLFLLWLAALLLAERLTALKVTCTVLGLVGVILVLDPTTSGTSLFAGLAGIAGALFGAALTIVVKRLSATEPTIRLMFYPLATVAVVFALPALLNWQPLDIHSALLVGGMTLFGSIGQWCFLNAYRLGEVSALAPVEYSRLIAAIIAGFFIFGEVPKGIAILGMVMIIGSTYATFRWSRV